MRYALPLLTVCLLPALCCAPQDVAPAEKYADAVKPFDAFVAGQVEQHGLPALSIALVDATSVVWAKGFGFADPKAKTPATAETVYRVGSVSKLFTDLAVMQLVEQGKLDLDAAGHEVPARLQARRTAVRKPITLRQLMAHRSGLVREPPVGNYFDPTSRRSKRPSRASTAPTGLRAGGRRSSTRNAGIAVVGYVLEKTAEASRSRLRPARRCSSRWA